jgi:hypothetical protein
MSTAEKGRTKLLVISSGVMPIPLSVTFLRAIKTVDRADQNTRDDETSTRSIRAVDRLDGYIERATIPHALMSECRQPKLLQSIIGI